MTVFVAGSMRETVPSSEFATHTEPSPNAMPVGPLPTLTVSTTLPRRESMRTTVRLDPSVTQTLPPPTAMPRPIAPVGIVSTTRPRTTSILVTLRSSALVTQTAPSPTARAVGVTPTGIAWTSRFVCGSIRDTVPSSEFATQTAPPPTAIPPGSPPTSMRWTTAPVLGSMRETERSSAFVTHTDPSPTATLVGPLPTGTSATSRFDLASIAATEFAEAELSPGLSPPVSSMPATAVAADRRRTAPIAIRTPLLRRARTRGVAGFPGGSSSRVLSQDRALELLQTPARLEAELLCEHPARLLIRLERLRLAARAIEGEHELSAQTLPQRMLADKGLELGDELGVAAEGEVGLDPLLEGSQVQLLEASDLALREGLGREVRKGRSAPECECGP